MTDESSAATRPCRLERRWSRDLELVVVANDDVTLVFVPAVGGRLISCRFQGHEMLWHDPNLLDDDLALARSRAGWPDPDGTMASWTNLGGNKTWPAPQGWDDADQWHGPPDPVLDSGAYEVETGVDDDGTALVVLTSGVDPTTGVQITRRFRLPASGAAFEQTSTFRNRSERPVTWAVWDVTQVDTDPTHGAAGVVLVETTGRPGPVEHLFTVEGGAIYERHDRHWHVPTQDVVAKLGFPDATGVLEWRRDDGLTLQLETSRREGTYPDRGCPVELWLQHPLRAPVPALGGLQVTAHLVELEVMSPLTTLMPGDIAQLGTIWRLSRARTRGPARPGPGDAPAGLWSLDHPGVRADGSRSGGDAPTHG